MNNILRIARKEVAGFFSSPISFIFLGSFLAVILFIFFLLFVVVLMIIKYSPGGEYSLSFL